MADSISLNSQIKYISNGPLDAKAYVNSKEELSAFTSGEKYIGMTVVVSNARTTKEPEEYWLVGGIGKNKWVKKTPNLQLKLDDNGFLHLELEDGAAPTSGSAVDIKTFIEEQVGDVFVKSGSVVTEDKDGNEGVFLKLIYSDDAKDAIYIDITSIVEGKIHLEDYYTKEESDARFVTMEDVAEEVNTIFETLGPQMLQDYPKREEVEGMLSGYTTSDDVQNMIKDFVTSGDVKDMVQDFITSGDVQDMLEGYTTSGDVQEMIQDLITSGIVEDMIKDFITSGDVENMLEDYAKTSEVEDMIKNFITSGDVENMIQGFVTSGEVEQMIDEKIAEIEPEEIKIADQDNNALTYDEDGLAIYITGNDTEI